MSYKQVRSFNKSAAGTILGNCLQNVRKGYGIGVKYPTAYTAWLATQKHQSKNIPSGIDTPLFYTYKAAGHINVHLANGEIWSDGVIYGNLDVYLAKHPSVRYLGWGESINGVPVVQFVADPTPAPTGTILHLDKGTDTTTFNDAGIKVGSIHAKDDTYDYTIRENRGNKVKINSASGGGNGVWVYLTYTATGQPIPGRHVK